MGVTVRRMGSGTKCAVTLLTAGALLTARALALQVEDSGKQHDVRRILAVWHTNFTAATDSGFEAVPVRDVTGVPALEEAQEVAADMVTDRLNITRGSAHGARRRKESAKRCKPDSQQKSQCLLMGVCFALDTHSTKKEQNDSRMRLEYYVTKARQAADETRQVLESALHGLAWPSRSDGGAAVHLDIVASPPEDASKTVGGRDEEESQGEKRDLRSVFPSFAILPFPALSLTT